MSKKRNKKTTGKRIDSGKAALAALPVLSKLEEIPPFEKLKITDEQLAFAQEEIAAIAKREGVDESEFTYGCVVRLDRGFPAILCKDNLLRAEFSTTLSKAKQTVSVGDWVCVRLPDSHDKGLIVAVCPRKTELSRWKGGNRALRQVLAANVDKVLIAQSFIDRDFSLDRIARSVVVALDCGCKAEVVLTKCDLTESSEELTERIELLKMSLADDIKIIATCARLDIVENEYVSELKAAALAAGASWGIEGIYDAVSADTVAILLGESGAGKSTLLNLLLGKEILETGAVRDKDGAGRHTTVARRMVNLEGHGIIIDEPGLRSLPILGHERGLALAYPEISQYVPECKFRDCTHDHEPGCAVKEALDAGAFSSERLAVYLDLAREMRESLTVIDPDIVI